MSGLELQDYLTRNGIEIPIVFVTAHADVPTAVTALKGGAVDLIEKPFDYRQVLSIIEKAFQRDAESRGRRGRRAEIAQRLATLTEREREVLRRIIDGKPNKIIAAELDLSVKTVEVHRAKVMEKMGAESVAELVQRTIGFPLIEPSPSGG
jgi:FixJ family two-component response regulator